MSTRELIQAELEEVDEALLADIYLFIKTFIQAKKSGFSPHQVLQESTASYHAEDSSQVADPLGDFIGAVAHGSLAFSLDEKLYSS